MIFRPDLIRIETIIRLKTRIAGYCASSTDFSDHSLKKIQKKFQVGVVFYLHVAMKRSERNTGLRPIWLSQEKSQLETTFEENWQEKQKMKNFVHFFLKFPDFDSQNCAINSKN